MDASERTIIKHKKKHLILSSWIIFKVLSHSHIFLSIVASAIHKQSVNMFRLTLMLFSERTLFPVTINFLYSDQV